VRYSDYYIADSPVIQTYFRDKYGIEAVYIAYGAELYGQADVEVLDAHGVSPGEYFLLMARMEPENNIEMILEGYVKSETRRPMLVVGNMNNGFSRHLQARFGSDPRVKFTGGIYDQWKLHCLKAFCRLYFHGHSTGGTNPSLLEAMASQALIAAHDNPFNRQVLERDALYFSSPEHIMELVDSLVVPLDAAGIRLRNRAKVAERFSWPDIIDQYERFILHSLSLQPSQATHERDITYRRYSGQ